MHEAPWLSGWCPFLDLDQFQIARDAHHASKAPWRHPKLASRTKFQGELSTPDL